MTTYTIAVSRAGKRDELLSKVPSKEGNAQVQWIWAGMLIELEQYVVVCSNSFDSSFCTFRHTLKSDIRALGQSPSPEERTHIQERWESLQTKIDDFHQQALQYIQSDIAFVTHSSSNRAPEVIGVDLEESDEEAFFLDAESEWEEEEEVETPAERARLWLPSSFTKSERVQMGLGRVAEVEVELREGQANDALEALRAGLAEKSLRFRTEVKPAKSQKNNN